MNASSSTGEAHLIGLPWLSTKLGYGSVEPRRHVLIIYTHKLQHRLLLFKDFDQFSQKFLEKNPQRPSKTSSISDIGISTENDQKRCCAEQEMHQIKQVATWSNVGAGKNAPRQVDKLSCQAFTFRSELMSMFLFLSSYSEVWVPPSQMWILTPIVLWNSWNLNVNGIFWMMLFKIMQKQINQIHNGIFRLDKLTSQNLN